MYVRVTIARLKLKVTVTSQAHIGMVMQYSGRSDLDRRFSSIFISSPADSVGKGIMSYAVPLSRTFFRSSVHLVRYCYHDISHERLSNLNETYRENHIPLLIT